MPVLDSSVLVAAVADAGPVGRWAEEVLAAGALIAPELALVESYNVLARLERRGKLGTRGAERARRALLDLPLELLPFRPFAGRVWRLRANLTAYDAWYVAVAEALGEPLATLDARLSAAAGPRCEFLLPPAAP